MFENTILLIVLVLCIAKTIIIHKQIKDINAELHKIQEDRYNKGGENDEL